MIIIKLQGGLGNQLFQWAFGLSKALHSDVELKFDSSSYKTDRLRNLELTTLVNDVAIASKQEIENVRLETNLLTVLKRKLLTIVLPYYKRNIVCEQAYLLDEQLKNEKNTTNYFEGYWQNEAYFIANKTIVLDKLNFKINTSKAYINHKADIKLNKHNAIAIHVRRGDYVNDARILKIHGVCEIDYYKKAIESIKKEFQNCKFYIFSNDQDWSIKNFEFLVNKVIIDDTETVFEDLELMSLCKGQIIANSSLSWWSAWINQNPNKKIIAPKKWFNKTDIDYSELVPNSWLKI